MSIIFKMLKYLKNYSNLIIGVISIALVIILVIQTICLCNYKSSYEEEVNSGLVLQTELDSTKKQNEELKTKLSEQELIVSEKDTKIQQLEKDIKELKETQENVSEETYSNYPISHSSGTTTDGHEQSAQVWNHLVGLGLNKYVCAGIMGNIMAEVGGNTLDISTYSCVDTGTYYGICQWGWGRKDRLLSEYGTSLDDQLRFLSVELFEEIPKGSSFYNMQDEKEAALYFAKYYERCGSGSYSVRQDNASVALAYFTEQN